MSEFQVEPFLGIKCYNDKPLESRKNGYVVKEDKLEKSTCESSREDKEIGWLLKSKT